MDYTTTYPVHILGEHTLKTQRYGRRDCELFTSAFNLATITSFSWCHFVMIYTIAGCEPYRMDRWRLSATDDVLLYGDFYHRGDRGWRRRRRGRRCPQLQPAIGWTWKMLVLGNNKHLCICVKMSCHLGRAANWCVPRTHDFINHDNDKMSMIVVLWTAFVCWSWTTSVLRYCSSIVRYCHYQFYRNMRNNENTGMHFLSLDKP